MKTVTTPEHADQAKEADLLPKAKNDFPLVALAGPPNTGKTTLFNLLTGLRQRTANYPGVTVEISKGRMQIDDQWIDLMDLPGTHSLNSGSPDEQIAIDILQGNGQHRPDVIVNVIEAARPRNGLLVAWQIAAFDIPQVLVFNFADEATKFGHHLNPEAISATLGCPVVLACGKQKQGRSELHAAISQALQHGHKLPPLTYPQSVTQQATELQQALQQDGGIEISTALARRALFDARSTPDQGRWTEEKRQQFLSKARSEIMTSGYHPYAVESRLVEAQLVKLREQQVIPPELPAHYHPIDRLLLHRILGPVIFLFTMGLLFQAVYSWSGPAMDGIDFVFTWLADTISPHLASMPLLQGLITDGVILGAGGVVIFLPQIMILYALVTLLEDIGYLSRAAFLSDKFFSWCGLNGRSFVPMISSFACAIPGIMAARTIESRTVRHTTALLAPLMSCSARLPVYVLIIGILIEPRYGSLIAGLSLLACHLLGATVAMTGAWLWNLIRRHKSQGGLLMQIPPLRLPHWSNVYHRVISRAADFLRTAGTIILAASIIIWALATFPQPTTVGEKARQQAEQSLPTDTPPAEAAAAMQTAEQQAYFQQSYLARFGKSIQPIFAPAGFDWKLTVGVVASLPAREVIIATLGTIYGIADADEESTGLRAAIAHDVWPDGPRAGEPIMTLATGLSVIVFFALCMQCWATVSVLWRELGLRYAVSTFFGYTLLAWLGAVATYQLVYWITTHS